MEGIRLREGERGRNDWKGEQAKERRITEKRKKEKDGQKINMVKRNTSRFDGALR